METKDKLNKEKLRIEGFKKELQEKSWIIFNELDRFVKYNWEKLFIGALQLGYAIHSDYYAPERIQTNHIRFHESELIKKVCDEHCDRSFFILSDVKLKLIVNDINLLISAYNKIEDTKLKLIILNGEEK